MKLINSASYCEPSLVVLGRIVMIFLLLSCSSCGQEEIDSSQVAFVRIVNLVSPGEGNLKIKVDGEESWPAGYRLGQRTGGVGMKAGTRKFVFTKEGCLSAERDIDLVGDKTITLAIYGDPVLDEDTEEPILNAAGEVANWQIKVAQLSQWDPGEGYHLTFVSFCSGESLDLEVKPSQSDAFFVMAKYLETTKRKFSSEPSRVAVMYEGEVLNRVKGREEGNYVVMIYEGEEGKEALSFYDNKFLLAH